MRLEPNSRLREFTTARFDLPETKKPALAKRSNDICSGTTLGLLAGAALILFLHLSGVTGLVIQPTVQHLAFSFSTPKAEDAVGEPITFIIEPPDAATSIAYVREDGGIVMLQQPKFIPAAPGTYTFNALLSAHGLTQRKILSVQVHNR